MNFKVVYLCTLKLVGQLSHSSIMLQNSHEKFFEW